MTKRLSIVAATAGLVAASAMALRAEELSHEAHHPEAAVTGEPQTPKPDAAAQPAQGAAAQPGAPVDTKTSGGMMGNQGMMGPGMMGNMPMGMGMMGNQGMMGPGMMGNMPMGMGMMGYGMGPGMMGNMPMGMGMMGNMPRGMGMMGQGCGMMGPYAGGSQPAQNLTTNDVKGNFERWIASIGNPNIKVGNVVEKDANTITAEVVTKDNSLVQQFAVDRRTGFYRSITCGTT